MFITRDAYKSPVSALFLRNGEAGWSATELVLQQTWFLVQLQEFDAVDESEFSCCRTVLLFDFQSVEQFILSNQEGKVRLKSVHIVTPGHVNGSDSWKMDQLRAVWQGIEPIDEFEVPMDIFETVTGEKYTASFTGLSTKELASDTLKFEFSH
jgi:hypothetical protein